jgi:preprotein translocase subunit SecE
MAKTAAIEQTPNTGIENLKATPARLGAFLKDVRSEMRKVISPSQAEVKATTITVLVTVFVFAAYFWLVDSILGTAITALVHKLTTH